MIALCVVLSPIQPTLKVVPNAFRIAPKNKKDTVIYGVFFVYF